MAGVPVQQPPPPPETCEARIADIKVITIKKEDFLEGTVDMPGIFDMLDKDKNGFLDRTESMALTHFAKEGDVMRVGRRVKGLHLCTYFCRVSPKCVSSLAADRSRQVPHGLLGQDTEGRFRPGNAASTHLRGSSKDSRRAGVEAQARVREMVYRRSHSSRTIPGVPGVRSFRRAWP